MTSVDETSILDRGALCARVALFVLLLLPGAARGETSEGQQILTFEKSIQLSFVPERLEWSPDNRHLAAKGFNDGKLHIIDSDDERAIDRVILDRIGRASIAWSPDGQVVAVNQSAPIYGIRLASVVDAREIGRRQLVPGQKIDACLSASMPMAFTDDGKGLWVTCSFAPRVGARGVLPNFPIAEKYRLPDFSDEDRITLQSAIPGAGVLASVSSLARASAGISLSAIVGFHTPGLTRRFAYGFDLGSKAELFPPFEIVDDARSGMSRFPSQIITLPDRSFVLIRLSGGVSTRPGQQVDEKFDRLFEGYDPRTGQRTIAYGGLSGTAPERGVVGQIALLRDGRSIVGRWSRAAAREGGMVVFDARTGAVHQRIRSTENSLLSLSPDGRRVANVTRQGEMRLYRVRD